MNEHNIDLKACRLCLETNCRLYHINENNLGYILDEFTSSTASNMLDIPPYICSFCSALLRKATFFRRRCVAIQNYLHEHSLIEPLTMDIIQNTDRSKIKNQFNTSDIVIMYTVDEVDDKQDNFKSENISDDDGNDFDDDNDNYQLINPSDFVKLDEDIKPNTQSVIVTPVKEKVRISTKTKDKISKEELRDALQQLILETTDERKIAFYSYILEKHVWGMNVNLTDLEVYDEVLEKKLPNAKDLKKMDANETILYEYVLEMYQKGMLKEKKVFDVLRQFFKLPKEAPRQVKETKNDKDDKGVPFPDLYNFEKIQLTKKEQLEELNARKFDPKYMNCAYRCGVCFRGYKAEKALQSHMFMHDPRSGPAVCEICKSRFPTRRKMTDHMQIHKWKFICKLCGTSVKTGTDARIHNESHEGKTYNCEHCGKVFNRYKSRMEHIRLHHGVTRCDICYKGLVNQQAVNLHKSKTHKEVFICDVCSVPFETSAALDNHVSNVETSCHDVRPCSACGKNLMTEAELEKHIAKVHPYERPDSTRKHCWLGRRCCPCGHEEGDDAGKNMLLKLLPENTNMAENTETDMSDTNTGKRDCNCPCKYLVKRRKRRKQSELERDGYYINKKKESEEDENTPKKPKFMCEFCSKDFPSLKAMQKHQLVHTGEKPHECPVCGKRFRLKAMVQMHLTVHTGERAYKCNLCDKMFKTAAARNRHERQTHSSLRRHRCVICDKRFQTSWCVKLHVRTVHLKIPYVRRDKRKSVIVSPHDQHKE